MPHLLPVPHDLHQIVLVKLHSSRVLLPLDPDCHLRPLLHLELNLPQLKKRVLSYQLFLPIADQIDLEDIVRAGLLGLVHVYIKDFKVHILMALLYSIFFNSGIQLRIFIVLLKLPKRYTAIHPQNVGKQSLILLLHRKMPHNTIRTRMPFHLCSFHTIRTFRRTHILRFCVARKSTTVGMTEKRRERISSSCKLSDIRYLLEVSQIVRLILIFFHHH
jgi:hypothetical protein